MVYYRFVVFDSAGFNGSIYLEATNDANNILYRPSGTQTLLIFTKNLGSSSGHCRAIDYIFDKWFPQFRSQKPSCLSDPQTIIVEIGTKQGYGINPTGTNRFIMPNGEQYTLNFTSTTIHALGRSYFKKPPIQRFVRLNDFSNSKVSYLGKRPIGRNTEV